jgi:hypothetical protein
MALAVNVLRAHMALTVNVLRAHMALAMNSETMKQAEHWTSATDSLTNKLTN